MMNNNKRLIYITVIDFEQGKSSGVIKKILQNIKIFSENDFMTDYFFIRRKNRAVYLMKNGREIFIGSPKGIKGIGYWRLIRRYLKVHKYNFAYVRHAGRTDIEVLNTLKTLYLSGTKIVYEFPTFPYDLEGLHNLCGRLDHMVDKCFRLFIKRYVGRAVTFSKDISIFGIPTIQIMNGIIVDDIKCIEGKRQDDKIHLLGVALMTITHGYERIIQGMSAYKSNGGNKVIVHLVGDGLEKKFYMDLAHRLGVEDVVKFYPLLSGEKLDVMYEIADMALIDFGAYKENIFLTSALKSREALAKGLPMVTGCKIDVCENKRFPYVLEFPNDESAVDIFFVEKFYNDIIARKGKAEVAKEIRQFGKENIDMAITLKPVIDYLKE